MKRPQRPPPRPFPVQSRLESPSVLFERVTQASDSQYAAQVARDSLPQPTPRGWHHYHPQPTPPILLSPTTSTHGASSPLSRFASLGFAVGEARPPSPTFSPYPPAAPQPTPTQRLSNLFPFSSTGSTSTIYKTVIKRPALVQLYLNGDELHTNAPDVESQFLAELRAYRTAGQHPNIVAFLGCLDSVGMIMEFIEGDTFFERVIKKRTSCLVGFGDETSPAVSPRLKVEWFNQLVDALVHVHKHGLSHGDINTLNVLITHPTAHPPNAVKLIDFGRSTFFNPLPPTTNATTSTGPISSFHARHPSITIPSISSPPFVNHLPPSETPQPSAHPFAAPELIRGGRYIDPITKKKVPCDGRIADAYSLGILLWCLDEERLVDLDRDLQRKEDVVLFNIPDDDEEETRGRTSDSGSDSDVRMDDGGYGAEDEDEEARGQEKDKPVIVVDEGYFSADAALKRRAGRRGTSLARSSRSRSRCSPSPARQSSNTREPNRRLFTKLIKGYTKKWEERTKISLDQKMTLPFSYSMVVLTPLS